MVFLFYDNKHKGIGKKLAAFLAGKNIKVITEQKFSSADKTNELSQKIKKADFAILIFSQDINKSKKIIDFYDLVYENDIPLILFVVSDLEYSLSMQFLLDGNDWIDAHNVKFSDAANALVDLLKNYSSEREVKEKNKKNPDNPPPKEQKKKKQTYWAAALIIIFATIIGYFIFIQNNDINKKDNISVPDSISLTNNRIIPNKDQLFVQYLIGTWRLSAYEDNIIRTPDEQASLDNEIERLKRDFLLILNEDGTFKRTGFTQQVETGYWDVDAQNKILYIWPPNSQQKDRLIIQKLTQTDLILVIATSDQQGNQIITTLTLKKAG